MARFLAFIIGIAGLVIASQGPAFTTQYMQNLEGRVDELTRAVASSETEFGEFGYNRESALVECRTAQDLLEAMCSGYRTNVERLKFLIEHQKLLSDAQANIRPLILARNYDKEIAHSVYGEYAPAVPTTIDGGIYAVGGFFVSWGLSIFVLSLLGGLFGGRR